MTDFNDLVDALRSTANSDSNESFFHCQQLMLEAADAIDLLLRLNEKHESLIEQQFTLVNQMSAEIVSLKIKIETLYDQL